MGLAPCAIDDAGPEWRFAARTPNGPASDAPARNSAPSVPRPTIRRAAERGREPGVQPCDAVRVVRWTMAGAWARTGRAAIASSLAPRSRLLVLLRNGAGAPPHVLLRHGPFVPVLVESGGRQWTGRSPRRRGRVADRHSARRASDACRCRTAPIGHVMTIARKTSEPSIVASRTAIAGCSLSMIGHARQSRIASGSAAVAYSSR